MTPTESREEIAGARHDLGRALNLGGPDRRATLQQAIDRVRRVLDEEPAAPAEPEQPPESNTP